MLSFVFSLFSFDHPRDHHASLEGPNFYFPDACHLHVERVNDILEMEKSKKSWCSLGNWWQKMSLVWGEMRSGEKQKISQSPTASCNHQMREKMCRWYEIIACRKRGEGKIAFKSIMGICLKTFTGIFISRNLIPSDTSQSMTRRFTIIIRSHYWLFSSGISRTDEKRGERLKRTSGMSRHRFPLSTDTDNAKDPLSVN